MGVFLARLAALPLLAPPATYPVETDYTARALLDGRGFSDPFLVPTGPTAHLAPVMPWLLAAASAACGGRFDCGVSISRVVACIAVAATLALLPVLTYRLGLGTAVGVGAAVVGALPLFIERELEGRWEAPLAALLLVAMAVLAARGPDVGSVWRRALQLGTVGGLGALTSPILALPAAGLTLLWVTSPGWRVPLGVRWRAVGLVVVTGLLVIGPWILRDRMQLGSWMFIRDNFGLELAMSNTDGARPTFTENMNAGLTRRHPFLSVSEAERVAHIGEVAYNRERQAEAMAWIRTHRERFAALTVARVATFWFHLHRSRLVVPLGLGVSGLGLAGVLLLLVRRHRAGVVLAITMLLYSLPYYLIQTDPRYRLPVQWTLYVGTAVAIASILRARQAPTNG